MLEGDGVLTGRQLFDGSHAVAPLGNTALVVQNGAGDDVGRLDRLRPAPLVGDVNDREGTPGITGVGEFHAFPHAEAGQPSLGTGSEASAGEGDG